MFPCDGANPTGDVRHMTLDEARSLRSGTGEIRQEPTFVFACHDWELMDWEHARTREHSLQVGSGHHADARAPLRPDDVIMNVMTFFRAETISGPPIRGHGRAARERFLDGVRPRAVRERFREQPVRSAQCAQSFGDYLMFAGHAASIAAADPIDAITPMGRVYRQLQRLLLDAGVAEGAARNMALRYGREDGLGPQRQLHELLLHIGLPEDVAVIMALQFA